MLVYLFFLIILLLFLQGVTNILSLLKIEDNVLFCRSRKYNNIIPSLTFYLSKLNHNASFLFSTFYLSEVKILLNEVGHRCRCRRRLQISQNGSQNLRGGTFCALYTRGPRAHECAGPELVGSSLPKLPTRLQAGHLGPLTCPLWACQHGKGGGAGGRWQAQRGP